MCIANGKLIEVVGWLVERLNLQYELAPLPW